MKLFFVSTLFLLSNFVLGVNTEGRLTFPKVKTLTVGEVVEAELLLLPFEEKLVDEKAIEGKNFLNLFYVANVNSIKTSENNYDAVVVSMDLILPQNFKPQELYIWQLGDRNIPIKIDVPVINDVTLNAKDFVVYSPPPVDFDEIDWNYLLIGSITLILLGGILYQFKRTKSFTKPGDEIDYISLMSGTRSHKDLEELYRVRREIFLCVHDEETKNKLNTFFEKYKWEQFKPDWKNTSVDPLITEAKELSKELRNGV